MNQGHRPREVRIDAYAPIDERHPRDRWPGVGTHRRSPRRSSTGRPKPPTVSPRSRARDWSIALRVAPLIVTTALAKVGADRIGWDTVELNPLHTGLVAGNIFLIGFLLSGTLTDYKESERMPGEFAARAETIADECEILYRDTGADVARHCLEQVGALARSLNSCCEVRRPLTHPSRPSRASTTTSWRSSRSRNRTSSCG